MGRLKRMQDKVEYLLAQYPATRDDDRKLIGAVYTVFYGVDVNAPFKDILLNDKLPNFETIRRCRQKVQQENEDLRADDPVEEVRIAKQEDFLEYAREDVRI